VPAMEERHAFHQRSRSLWYFIPRELVKALSGESFKTRLDKALEKIRGWSPLSSALDA